MKTITAAELKTKLDRRDALKLVMVLNAAAFRKAHIPGSINIFDKEIAIAQLQREEEIVVYCSDISCTASIFAYHWLTEAGYTNVSRFAGGLREWTSAGYEVIPGV